MRIVAVVFWSVISVSGFAQYPSEGTFVQPRVSGEQYFHLYYPRPLYPQTQTYSHSWSYSGSGYYSYGNYSSTHESYAPYYRPATPPSRPWGSPPRRW